MKKIFLITIIGVALFLDVKAIIKPLPSPAYHIKIKADEGVKIKLVLGDKTYDLIAYNMVYSAMDKSLPVETTLVPTSYNYPYNQFNSLSVTIKSSKVDQQLMDWMLSPNKETKAGQIIITDGETGKISKTITFTELKANSYSENVFNNGSFNSNIPTTTAFSMHYKTVHINLQ